MAVTYLKKAEKTPQTGTDETRRIVETMLAKIESEGESKVPANFKNNFCGCRRRGGGPG